MPSPFAALDQVASATVSAVMGETWLIQPQTSNGVPNTPVMPDPVRPPRFAIGIFADPPQMLGEIKGYLPPADKKPGLFAGDARVDFDPRLPANAGLIVRRADIIQRDNGEIYSIHAVTADAMGRFICHLTKNN